MSIVLLPLRADCLQTGIRIVIDVLASPATPRTRLARMHVSGVLAAITARMRRNLNLQRRDGRHHLRVVVWGHSIGFWDERIHF